MPQDVDLLEPGTLLAQRYRIEQHIGSGGYANVYRAIDLQLRRERAIKEVYDSDKGVREQFTVESSLLIQSTHPNIPRGFQLFEERGKLYLVMEFVRGRDLEDWLNESLVQRRRPLDEPQVLRWAIEVCGALEETHQRRPPVIHRDIKPANIKITPEGKPVLIDFGLAKLQTSGPTHTAAQGVSPGFAPPEQYMARGHTDARTDVYGMGATLYACLTGKDPPEAPARLLAQTGTAGQKMIPPRELVKQVDISEATNALVVKALELAPAKRQQSASELRAELEASLARLQSGGLGQSSGRRPTVIAPAANTGTAVAAAAATLTPPSPPAPKPSKAAAPRTAKQPAMPPAPPQQPAAMVPPFRLQPSPAAAPAMPPPAFATPPRQQPSPMASVAIPPYPLTPQTTGVAPGKQHATAAVTAVMPVAPSEHFTALPVAGTSKQKAVARRHGAAVATAEASSGTAVLGALALAPTLTPPAVPIPPTRQSRRDTRGRAKAAAAMAAAPIVPPLRSWVNLHGPQLSSLGKFALAMAAAETWWGVFLAALAVIQVMTHGQSRALPFLVAVMVWLGLALIICVLGGQVLIRPILRSGQLHGFRRGAQGTGLFIHALAVHGIAIWGAIALAQHQLNPSLALVAFVLFAVNVLAGGVLSLANTLG